METGEASTQGPRPLRVFVACTATDLIDHAAVVHRVIQEREWVPVHHGLWTAPGRPTVATCVDKVASCDLLVVLVAHRYGWVPDADAGGDGRRSITWLEVDRARDLGLPVLPFLVDGTAPWPPVLIEALEDPSAGEGLKAFIDTFEGQIVSTFQEAHTLEAPLTAALVEQGRRLEERRVARAERAAEPAPAERDAGGPELSAEELAARRAAVLTVYRSWLERRHQNVRLLGRGVDVRVRLPIAELYVPMRALLLRSLEPLRFGRRPDAALRERADHCESIRLGEAFSRAREAGMRGLLLLGDPGAGKSTIARRLAWEASRSGGPSQLGLPEDVLPIRLALGSLRVSEVARGFKAFVTRKLAGWCRRTEDRLRCDPQHLSDALWAHPRLLWILDGFDELPDARARERVRAWVDSLLESHAGHVVMVTGRYSALSDEDRFGPRLLELHLEDLARDQRIDFVHRWFQAVEAQVGAPEGAEQRAEDRAEELNGILDGETFRVGRLHELAANPLLLSVLCLVHRRNQLSSHPTRVYERCLQVLLDHWRDDLRSRQQRPSLEVDEALDRLGPLAWWMHEDPGRQMASGDELRQALGADAAASSGEPSGGVVDGDLLDFLHHVRDESGVLANPDPERFGFLHLAFQEYLAARHAVRRGLGAALARRSGSSWWTHVLDLALASGDRRFNSSLFRALLANRASVDELPRLLELVRVAQPLSQQPFVEALQHDDPDIRRVVLRVLRGTTDSVFLEAAQGAALDDDLAVRAEAHELLLRAGRSIPVQVEATAGGAAPMIGRSKRSADLRVEPRSQLAFVRVPAGRFRMGGELSVEEQPLRYVRVDSFWIAREPVTNAQYERFLEAHPDQRPPRSWEHEELRGPRQPVVGVGWHEARAFCAWIGARLPTEAQWEYACRAGERTSFCYGDDARELHRHAWHRENSDGRTHDTALKPPNAWGLYDMHGQCLEWCDDTWIDDYVGAPVDASSRRARGSIHRVTRGGFWGATPAQCRAAARSKASATSRHRSLGLRPVLRG